MLTQWYRSGGQSGVPFEDQDMIELAFALGKTVDELESCDEYWLSRMLMSHKARILARKK